MLFPAFSAIIYFKNSASKMNRVLVDQREFLAKDKPVSSMHSHTYMAVLRHKAQFSQIRTTLGGRIAFYYLFPKKKKCNNNNNNKVQALQQIRPVSRRHDRKIRTSTEKKKIVIRLFTGKETKVCPYHLKNISEGLNNVNLFMFVNLKNCESKFVLSTRYNNQQ